MNLKLDDVLLLKVTPRKLTRASGHSNSHDLYPAPTLSQLIHRQITTKRALSAVTRSCNLLATALVKLGPSTRTKQITTKRRLLVPPCGNVQIGITPKRA